MNLFDIIFQPLVLAAASMITLVWAILFFRVWQRIGRDEIVHRTIVPEFEPPKGLRPAEIGVLVDESADTLDVSATIVDLVIQGFITIKEIPKRWRFGAVDYQLIHTTKSPKDLLPYEKLLYNRLFDNANITSVRLSELKYSFFYDLLDVQDQLTFGLIKKGLFVDNPLWVKGTYILWGIGLASLGLVVGIIGISSPYQVIIGIGMGLVFSGILMIATSRAMPKRTKLGSGLYHKALGYELFLANTEKYRQPFFEHENLYLEVLPYAMVFKITNKLTEAFKKLDIQPPDQKIFEFPPPFNLIGLIGHLDLFSDAITRLIESKDDHSQL